MKNQVKPYALLVQSYELFAKIEYPKYELYRLRFPSPANLLKCCRRNANNPYAQKTFAKNGSEKKLSAIHDLKLNHFLSTFDWKGIHIIVTCCSTNVPFVLKRNFKLNTVSHEVTLYVPTERVLTHWKSQTVVPLQSLHALILTLLTAPWFCDRGKVSILYRWNREAIDFVRRTIGRWRCACANFPGQSTISTQQICPRKATNKAIRISTKIRKSNVWPINPDDKNQNTYHIKNFSFDTIE